MELNDTILQTLKNFAGINSSIVIDEGKMLRTVAEAKNIVGYMPIDQEFPRSFGVYDLNEFLSVLGLVDTPRIRFEDKYMLIGDSSGRSTIKYFYTDPDMLTTAPQNFKMPEANIKFELTTEVLNKLKRAASALGHSSLAVKSGEGCVTLSIVDSENSTSNTFSIDVPADFPDTAEFTLIFNISNLKLMAGDYDVEISSKLISHFINKDTQLEYFIAIEKTSSYED